MISDRSAAAAWDAEYQACRYAGEPPVRFTQDILTAAHAAGITAGLYIGCGNGRNYLPLTAAGLDLTGLDISAAAIAQLIARTPQRRNQLIPGDLTILPTGARYPLVIGIQVFQHGDRAVAHAHIRAAQERVAPGGLFCLRVNATATDIWPGHEVTGRDPDGGLTGRLPGRAQARPVHPLLQRRGTGGPLSPVASRRSCRRGCSTPGVSHPSAVNGPNGKPSGARPADLPTLPARRLGRPE